MESTIVMRSVSALKCYENNPRHNENAVEKVAESIKEFGFLVPIVIDTNDVRKPWSICNKSDNGCYFISLVKE